MKNSLPIYSRIFFILILSFMFFGPMIRQVFGVDNNLFRPWIMFSGTGVGIRDVDFYVVFPDGELKEIDRFLTLGYEPPFLDLPNYIWRMDSLQDIEKVADLLCSVMGYEKDLRVVTRNGLRRGWIEEFSAEANLCFDLEGN